MKILFINIQCDKQVWNKIIYLNYFSFVNLPISYIIIYIKIKNLILEGKGSGNGSLSLFTFRFTTFLVLEFF